MSRQKGSKNKVVQTQGVKATKEIEPELTPVTEVKVKTVEPQETPLKKGDTFLVKVNGADMYWTKTIIDIAFKRNSHTIEIPKGSSYTPPVGVETCVNCG